MEIIGRQGVYVALEDDRIEKIRLVVMDRNNERIKDCLLYTSPSPRDD